MALIINQMPLFKGYYHTSPNQLNKTLNIDIHQDPTKHLETFLQSWLQFGAYEQISELEFELIGRSGKASTLSLTQYKIIISGDIPSETFMLIDALAKACEADKIIEGEVIDKHQTNQTRFNGVFGNTTNAEFQIPFGLGQLPKITAMSKTKMILVLIIAIPLLIIMIPIAIVVMIFKIIMFKLKFK